MSMRGDIRVGGAIVVMSGIAIVDRDETLALRSNDGSSATIRWSRDDDNMITSGTAHAIEIDMPIQQSDVDVVHVASLNEQETGTKIELRLHVSWIHQWSRVVSYTLLADAPASQSKGVDR